MTTVATQKHELSEEEKKEAVNSLLRISEIRREVEEKQRRVREMLGMHLDRPGIFSFFQEGDAIPDIEDQNWGGETKHQDTARNMSGSIEHQESDAPGFYFSNENYRKKKLVLASSKLMPASSIEVRNGTIIKTTTSSTTESNDDNETPSTRSSDGDEISIPVVATYKEQAKSLPTRFNPQDLMDEVEGDEGSADEEVGTLKHFDTTQTTTAIAAGDTELAGSGSSNRRSFLCWPGRQSEPDYEDHLGGDRQYWRDIILGVNDGLVSTFLLVAGVTGANLSNTDILLTAVSGTIAGAISMSAGEYVATKTQEEVMQSEIKLERKHIQKNREAELMELVQAFELIGIPAQDKSEEVVRLRCDLLEYYKKNDEAHLQVHAALELGVIEEEKRNPLVAAAVSFFLFFFGAMPSVIPFASTDNTQTAFIAAGISTTLGLLFVGAIKTWATRGSLLAAAAENVVIAAGGGAIAYGVGLLFDGIVR